MSTEILDIRRIRPAFFVEEFRFVININIGLLLGDQVCASVLESAFLPGADG